MIVVIIIVKKRDVVFRGFKSKDKIKEKTHTYSATLNQGYELAKPLDSGSSQGYEFAKPFSKNHDMTGNSLKNSYEFAVVIKDDDYMYTDTKEGEYDTLHNKDKRKIREGEGNLYSHTRVGVGTENDYDTTYRAKENDFDIYDHSSGVVKQNGDNNIDENPYDHTHTNM